MISSRMSKLVACAGMLVFCAPVLLAGDMTVEGNVTATSFSGSGAGLSGVVKTEVDPTVGTLMADKWCKADGTGSVINCDQDAPANLEGVKVGDMQYWNGSAWVLIPAPPAREVTLTSCKGVPRWSSTDCLYAIGEVGPAGGVVFHVTQGGVHGLEAAPVDQSSGAAWGCYDVETGAVGLSVGAGVKNTAVIMADSCSAFGIAAEVADSYILNGFSDWFLPSIGELDLLFQQKSIVGGFASESYWSSTESSRYDGWYKNFISGNQGPSIKNEAFGVRAIRAF